MLSSDSPGMSSTQLQNAHTTESSVFQILKLDEANKAVRWL